MPNDDEYDKMTLEAVQARFSSLPKSSLNSSEYKALHAAIVKKSKEREVELQQKYDETISESRKSNRLSISAIAISALSLIVAIVALYIAYRSFSD
jgi:hypothetical protein